MRSITLSASILSADFSKLGEQLKEAEWAEIDWIHVDVMDGHFVPNITMGPFIVATCRRISALPLDVHLMIEQPERHIEAFAEAGANWLTVHIEGNPNIHRIIENIHALGCKAGISINPGTPASAITSVLPYIDMVLVMTVNPGYSGQKFIPGVVEKIAEIKQQTLTYSRPIRIEVDGGITPDTLPIAHRAGADTFVAATSIFGHPDGIRAGASSLFMAVS